MSSHLLRSDAVIHPSRSSSKSTAALSASMEGMGSNSDLTKRTKVTFADKVSASVYGEITNRARERMERRIATT